MKIRLIGTSGECAAVLAILRAHLWVTEVSREYPARDGFGQVRVYVTTTDSKGGNR